MVFSGYLDFHLNCLGCQNLSNVFSQLIKLLTPFRLENDEAPELLESEDEADERVKWDQSPPPPQGQPNIDR